jgi:endonuclease/exonuclease/phosphatase family metal-dependent hydrolase
LILATYNLRSGGTGRSHWAKILDVFRPDVFLVQETVAPEEHLPPMLFPDVAGRAAWRKAGGRRWGSAVYIERGEPRPIELPDFHGHVVGMEVIGAEWPDGSQGSLRVFSIHAPARGSYHRAVGQILDMIASHAGGDEVVIGGDFNIGIGERHASEDRTTPAADLAIQRRLADEFGLVNCWQEANPERPLAQTLRWSNAPTIPYHCDGLFVPRSWLPKLRACEVISSPGWDALSDHNPVVAWFEVQKEDRCRAQDGRHPLPVRDKRRRGDSQVRSVDSCGPGAVKRNLR